MRTHSFAALMVLATSAGAQDLGTKPDPLTSAAASSGGGLGLMALVQMLIALGIVLAVVKWALPRFASSFNKRLAPGVGSPIKIEESAAFAGGNLYVVSVRGRDLLLASSQAGVSCLADLTPAETRPEAPAFGDLLERAQRTPSRAAIAVDEPTPEPDPSAIAEALSRLDRLAG
ncbi:MAG: flagellar biosynthetic protein FliO [Fimbriimonadaceae bacterium]|nr:flagellar biosynthetic protein FliO [Fimbriimonadaceae bacterium]